MTQAYPLQWPEGWARTPPFKRTSNVRFGTTFIKARGDLLDELRRLGARNVVVSSWLAIRNDGLPYAEQARRKIEDPGVAVYFELNNRPMVIARDAFLSPHDNLRSIGLAISHLRGLERHGGATMMERAFTGFAQIEAPRKREWWDILECQSNAARDVIESQFRRLAQERHPDRGGSNEAMAELNAARGQALRSFK